MIMMMVGGSIWATTLGRGSVRSRRGQQQADRRAMALTAPARAQPCVSGDHDEQSRGGLELAPPHPLALIGFCVGSVGFKLEIEFVGERSQLVVGLGCEVIACE